MRGHNIFILHLTFAVKARVDFLWGPPHLLDSYSGLPTCMPVPCGVIAGVCLLTTLFQKPYLTKGYNKVSYILM